MKMLSNDVYEKKDAEIKAENAANQAKKFVPDLFMPKVGEQIQVMFVNVTKVQDLNGLYCHIIHGTNAKGNSYELKIPCLKHNSENGDVNCPLCNHKHMVKNRWGTDCEESSTTFINPIVMIDMNMKYDKDAEKWVSKTDMKIVDGVQKKVTLEPTLYKYLNTAVKFRKNLVKFIQANGGDISGKVVTIQGCYEDKKGNIVATGEKFDKSYQFAINNDIAPVDLSKFEVPNVEDFFIEKTEQDMDLFVNTGKWYQPKDKTSDNNTAERNEEKESESAPAEGGSAEQYNNIPGTTFERR